MTTEQLHTATNGVIESGAVGLRARRRANETVLPDLLETNPDPVDQIRAGKEAAKKELDTILARAKILRESLGISEHTTPVGPPRAPKATRATRAEKPEVKTAKPKTEKAPKAKPTGERMARRSAEEISTLVETVRSLVAKHENGLRAEQIRAELGLAAKEMPRILKAALETKALKKSGEKRSTVYRAR